MQDMNMDPSTRVVGTIFNGLKSYINGNTKDATYMLNSTFKKSAVDNVDSIQYWDYFTTGTRMSKSLYKNLQNGVLHKKTLLETDRDYLSPDKRKLLTSEFGFNELQYTCLMNDTFTKVKDYNFLFKKHKNSVINKRGRRQIYGDIIDERYHIKLKSETDQYTIRLKIYLIKLLNTELTVEELLANSFDNNGYCEEAKLPDERLLSYVNWKKPFKAHFITELGTNLLDSRYFAENAYIAKTLERNLGPHDIWNLTVRVNLGNDIDLNRLFLQTFCKEDKHKEFPSSYFFIIAACGDPRSSLIRNEDNAKFTGSSPGRYNIDFKREISLVSKPMDEGLDIITIREISDNNDDFETDEFSNFFHKDRKTKVSAPVWDIDSNRDGITNSDKKYTLMYYETRLSVYQDKEKFIRYDLMDHQNEKEKRKKSNETNSTDDNDIFDIDNDLKK